MAKGVLDWATGKVAVNRPNSLQQTVAGYYKNIIANPYGSDQFKSFYGSLGDRVATQYGSARDAISADVSPLSGAFQKALAGAGEQIGSSAQMDLREYLQQLLGESQQGLNAVLGARKAKKFGLKAASQADSAQHRAENQQAGAAALGAILAFL